ncbi:nucleotidyltransferase domain-containing protein [Paenibacillus herberti]|nr:nucleotidyltransferase family protein [Paenibacillus herberti]
MDKEQSLLYAIFKSYCADEKLQEVQLYERVDWNSFLQLAGHHRVLPLLHHFFKAEADHSIPDFVLKRLREEHRDNLFKMMMLAGESSRIHDELEVSGVRSLFLKGPTLAFELYGDLSLRNSSDLDILIDLKAVSGNLFTLDRLMERLGYQTDDFEPSLFNEWKWRQHHRTYYNSLTKTFVEIHWRLSPGPLMEPSFEELWRERRRSNLPSCSVYYLGSTHLFYYLTLHGARHGWFRLRWLLDMDRLLRRNVDWDAVRKLLRRFQALHLGDQTLLMASRILNTPLPSVFLPIRPGSKGDQLTSRPSYYLKETINVSSTPQAGFIRDHKRYLFSMKSPLHKFLFLLSLFHPYPQDEKTMPLPKPFHFLYFPLRPFLWIWRKARQEPLL